MRKLVLTGLVAAAALGGTPAHATATDTGYLTGGVRSSSEAALVPCPPRDAVGEWGDVGVVVVCFPKRAPRWVIDQPNGCSVRGDITTAFQPMGNCVRTIDMGDHVKAWTYPGAVYEVFTVVWY